MGGNQGATGFITGQDNFNKSLFDTALWTIDDAVATSDYRTREKYFQMVKQVAANEDIDYRRKYVDGFSMQWKGRLIVTMNDDGGSLNMLPPMDPSIEDKVNLYKVSKVGVDWSALKKSLPVELPYLAGYLLQYNVPLKLKGTERFQVVHYHHPDLLEEAVSARSTSELELLLERWRRDLFRNPGNLDEFWKGSAGELYNMANGYNREMELCGIKCYRSLGRHLRNLTAEVDWVKKVGNRKYRVRNPFWEKRILKTPDEMYYNSNSPEQTMIPLGEDEMP
jgi:hypothetical protein